MVYALNARRNVYEVDRGYRKSLGILLGVVFLVVACRLERREDFDFTPTQPMRCGIFKSYYLVREIKEEIYPDLGMLLANASRLQLGENQKAEIAIRARHCTELCEVRKDNLRLMQEEIKRRLALNEIKGNLKLLAKEVNEFENAKREWLKEHTARYHEGLTLLSESQRAMWVSGEKALKPLPLISGP